MSRWAWLVRSRVSSLLVAFLMLTTFVGSKHSCAMVPWLSLGISGLSLYMQGINMMLTHKIIGKAYFKVFFWSRFVHFIRVQVQIKFLLNLGLQTHIHFPQFCWKGAKSHSVRQCSYPWHDKCNNCLNCLCCHTGKLFLLAHHSWLIRMLDTFCP